MAANSTPSSKRHLLLALGFVVSAALLYVLLKDTDFKQLTREMGRANVPLLIVAVLMIFGQAALMALRTRVVLRKGQRLTFWQLYKSIMIAVGGNNVLPLRMGELLRIDYLARRTGLPHTTTLGAVALERLFDIVMMASLMGVALPVLSGFGSKTSTAVFAFVVGAGGIISLAIACRNTPWTLGVVGKIFGLLGAKASEFARSRVEKLLVGAEALSRWPTFFASLGTTLLFWICLVAVHGTFLAAFDLGLPWYAPIILSACLALSAALPSSPGFVGTYHYAAYFALTALGASEEASRAYGVVTHACIVVPATVVAIALVGPELFGRTKHEPAAGAETNQLQDPVVEENSD